MKTPPARDRVRIETHGCRANKYDSALLRGALAARGYELVGPDEPFDILLLNTCTVTAAADRETRKVLRRHRRNNPDARLVMTGCYANVAGPGDLEQLEADLVLPNRGTPNLLAKLDELVERPPGDDLPLNLVPDPGRHTRFFFKIQEGCSVFCTYCIIPHARGPSRSTPPDDVVHTVRESCRRGYLETILSGINLGAYGRDLPARPSLASLAKRLLDETPVARLRLGSLEPWGVRDDLIDLLGDQSRLLPSVHIPLQSGSRPILEAMKRPSSPSRYHALISRLRAVCPNLTLWIDVIVGFPGETDARFEEGFEFISSLPFTKLHVFPYSPRAGTPAVTLPGQVPNEKKRERARRLLDLSSVRHRQALEARVGSRDEVLVEVDGRGKTRDNLPVQLEEWHEGQRGTLVEVALTGVRGMTLTARARPSSISSPGEDLHWMPRLP